MNQFHLERFRLRPSVSLTPLPQAGRYQFFLSDIRQSFNMQFADEAYTTILRTLDGSLTFDQLVRQHALNDRQTRGLQKLFELLCDRCVLEDLQVVQARAEDPFRRVKNFIASYVPYEQVETAWERVVNGHAVIIGAGGVGSWVVSLLAQFGVRHFTLLDDDVVKPHNLNRSIFSRESIGLPKTQALAEMLATRISNYYSVDQVSDKLKNPHQLVALLQRSACGQTILINCADYPSVTQTSVIVNEAAFACNVPYIIAGGYNMHLSLVGPTIIPGESPCFHCISHAMEQIGIDALEGAERIVKEHRNLGNIGPLAAISASFVANECLKLFVGQPYMQPTMLGKRGEFNFLTKKLTLEEYERWNECPCCGEEVVGK